MARRSRLAKAVPIQKYITKAATWMHSTNLVCFYPTVPAKLCSAYPQYWLFSRIEWHLYNPTLAVALGNEVNNNSWTCTIIHSTSLATFYSKRFCFYSELCLWITIMVFAIRLSHYQYYYTSLLKFAILFIYISYSWYDNSLWLLWEWALTYSTPAVSRIILFFFNCSFDWSQLYFFYLWL